MDSLTVTPQAVPSRPRGVIWSKEATTILIEDWGRRKMERGKLRPNDWAEVAQTVNSVFGQSEQERTATQCSHRIDTLKKKYKTEKAKIADSNGTLRSSWQFFSKLDQLIGSNHNALQIDQPENPVSPIDLTTSSPPMAVPLPPALPPQTSVNPPQLEIGGEAMEAVGGEATENQVAPESPKEDEEDGKMVAKAMERLGVIYERVEEMKQKEMVELEKYRIEMAKDLEVQKMKIFMDAQLELAKLMRSKSDS